IPTRALMALESFRQLILDAQAMMDPDFAGKLAADVAESQADDADTSFGFGSSAGEPESPELENVEAHFGDEDQMSLLDASHFAPAANTPKRPFLVMPSQNNQFTEASEKHEVSGHDFSRAAVSEKTGRASAPDGSLNESTPEPEQPAFRAP